MSSSYTFWMVIKQQQQVRKFSQPAKHQCFIPLFNYYKRCLSTQQRTPNIFSNGIIKSPFPDIVPPTLTIDQYIWQHLDQWPDHVAIECGISGRKYTFSQLQVLSKRFAASLLKQGLKPGTVVGVMLPNMPEYAIVVLGVLEAGLILTTINPLYTQYELSHQLKDSNAQAIVTLTDYLGKINSAKQLLEQANNSPISLLTIIVNKNSNTILSNVVYFGELISENIDISSVRPIRSLEDVALLPYSSGTTGLSKGVQLTHKCVVSNYNQFLHPHLDHIQPTTKNHQDTIAAVLPFFHIYGLSIILLRILSQGCKIITLPKFEPVSFLSLFKDKKISVLYAAPPIILFLNSHPLIKSEDFISLNFVINGAGPVSRYDGEQLISKLHPKLCFLQAYGMTETSPVVFCCVNNKSDFLSVGFPIRSTFAKIVKSDGTLGSVGESGEICIKGPQIMKGYHNKPEATAEIIDNEGYLHTGDVGNFDDEGKFYIIERMKELIKVKGFQVPPAELEAILREHPSVSDAAVVGIADDKTGEKPLGFVVAKKGAKINDTELKDFVGDKVAPYKKLSDIVVVDSIPKNPSGKILRRILKEEFLKFRK